MAGPWRDAWSALDECGRGEFVMGCNRVALGTAVFLACWVSSRTGGGLAFDGWPPSVAAWWLAAAALQADLLWRRRPSAWRRVAAVLLDTGGASVVLALGGSAGAWVAPTVYLWVVIGNGLRFGASSIILSTVASVAGFTAAALSTRYWLDQPALAAGVGVGLLVLPSYIYVLTRRLAESKRIAESATRAKDLFLASVSHELRTPLQSLSGAAELLRAAPPGPDRDQLVSTLRASSGALLSHVEALLDFSRLEAGHFKLSPAPFALDQLIQQSAAMIEVAAASKGISLSASVAGGAALVVSGDEARLRDVLLNLMSNAVKFTVSGTVSLSVDPVPLQNGWHRLRFEVRDTGPGIPLEAQSRIFDRFTQADDAVVRRFGGTGLGLALCDRLVRAMGGRIGVRSEPGQGSTFWFEVDLASCQPAAHGPAPSEQALPADPGAAAHGVRVLVADDTAANRIVVRMYLERLGFTVVPVANGEAALDALVAGEVDVALLDLMMPDIDGAMVMQQYRCVVPTGRRVPVLGITADGGVTARQRCLDAGMEDCLLKPVFQSGLSEAISRALAGRANHPAPGDQPPETPLLDQQVLDDLLLITGERLFPRAVESFLADASSLVGRIEAAADRDDADAFRFDSHALRSVALNLGARRLQRACEGWDRVSASMVHQVGLDGLAALRRAWEDTSHALRAHVASRLAGRAGASAR